MITFTIRFCLLSIASDNLKSLCPNRLRSHVHVQYSTTYRCCLPRVTPVVPMWKQTFAGCPHPHRCTQIPAQFMPALRRSQKMIPRRLVARHKSFTTESGNEKSLPTRFHFHLWISPIVTNSRIFTEIKRSRKMSLTPTIYRWPRTQLPFSSRQRLLPLLANVPTMPFSPSPLGHIKLSATCSASRTTLWSCSQPARARHSSLVWSSKRWRSFKFSSLPKAPLVPLSTNFDHCMTQQKSKLWQLPDPKVYLLYNLPMLPMLLRMLIPRLHGNPLHAAA